jgi:hypothetical protein
MGASHRPLSEKESGIFSRSNAGAADECLSHSLSEKGPEGGPTPERWRRLSPGSGATQRKGGMRYRVKNEQRQSDGSGARRARKARGWGGLCGVVSLTRTSPEPLPQAGRLADQHHPQRPNPFAQEQTISMISNQQCSSKEPAGVLWRGNCPNWGWLLPLAEIHVVADGFELDERAAALERTAQLVAHDGIFLRL